MRTHTHTHTYTHTHTHSEHSRETLRGQTGKERREGREMKGRSSFKEKKRDVLQSERGWKHTHTHTLKKHGGDTQTAHADVDSGK